MLSPFVMKNGLLAGLTTLALLAGSTIRADEPVPAEPSFHRHIVPLFSRLGCNAGSCHGAVKGQNGFRLSLFGVDPAQDHDSIHREFGGRRLDRFDPANSLLLLKAMGALPHQGGARTAAGSFHFQLLSRWLEQGARLDPAARGQFKQLRVEPENRTAKTGETFPLRVQATFMDGSVEDVTSLATFEAIDKQVVQVNAEGQVTVEGIGDTAIVVRFGAEPIMARVTVPREGKEPFPRVVAHNFVDDHIVKKLQQLNIHPAELCDDAAFLRRACLDVTGALPEPDEVRAFLADKDPGKRAKKVDDLLNRPGYAALWATKFSDLLKASGFDGNYAMVEAAENRRFYDWLRARFQENTPYDQFVERILTATSGEGRSKEDWLKEVQAFAEENARLDPELAVYSKRKTLDLYWQRREATGLKGTLQVAHAFLGLRLECAQCHRHPHDVWQQDDLLSFANFFMKVKGAGYPDAKSLPPEYAAMLKKGPEEAKKLRAEAKKLADKAKDKKLDPAEAKRCQEEAAGLEVKARALESGPKRFGTEIYISDKGGFASVTSPLGTQKSDKYRLLGEAKPVSIPAGTDPRVLVMEWLRRPDNPFFARAIVNRVWAHYFGRGLVDPADHLSPLNPASHPELLTELSEGFIRSGYDLKWLHRTILASRTYQQSPLPHPTAKDDRRNFASFYLRRLPAEVLVDAVNHATGARETFPPRLFLRPGAKALEIAGTLRAEDEIASVAFAFQIFGRPLRNSQVQCDCEREAGATAVQALYLANHPQVREKIASPQGRVARLIKDIPEDGRRVEELFLWALSRPPSREETQTCLEYIQGSPSPQRGLEDVLWSLLNTREFILNH